MKAALILLLSATLAWSYPYDVDEESDNEVRKEVAKHNLRQLVASMLQL